MERAQYKYLCELPQVPGAGRREADEGGQSKGKEKEKERKSGNLTLFVLLLTGLIHMHTLRTTISIDKFRFFFFLLNFRVCGFVVLFALYGCAPLCIVQFTPSEYTLYWVSET